ncbi:SusD/RagB family nutrient-binding outer membrane lipoprotein [Niabella hirudinis]|uniref:SusD/RagB family nutrient-binding outer membrane lipoprotein n=1 Tax=Niabella hirudinis TaxID=1285929 RepID=UPI003EBE851B
MKRILIAISIFSIMISSCKKTLEKEFYNPEVYSDVGSAYAGYFSKTLYTWKLYVQDYGEWWWEIAGSGAMGVAGYSQIAQRYIRNDVYDWFADFDDLSGVNAFGSEGQLYNNRFGSFYVGMNAWASMKNSIGALSGQDLDDNQIYYALTTVMKDYNALMTVDFYNSVPYSEAFRGKESIFFPKYDDPKSIYVSVLDELKTISEQLVGQYDKMSSNAKATFGVQDIAFGGDINKWVQYINAIRLRYAVRLSGVDEATAKTQIQDLIAKNNFPAADFTWQLPYAQGSNYGGEWIRGISEAWAGTFVTDIIMKRMNYGDTTYQPGIDDPRLPVIAMPTATSKYSTGASDPDTLVYRGVSMNADGQTPGYTAGQRYYTGGVTGDINAHLKQNYRSLYNLATFYRNENFPVYMMSRAEVDLLLAEVALKNLATTPKSASDYLKDAVSHSTDFWYMVNQKSPTTTGSPGAFAVLRPAKPAASIIDIYATTLATKYNSKASLDEKMEIIMQQKYIHLNLMYPYELWAELRRTRHPKLDPLTYDGKVMKPLPEKLRYPVSERTNNPDNYELHKAEDNFTTPIFWVPQNLRSVNPYWDNYDHE